MSGAVSFDGSILFGFPLMRVSELAIAAATGFALSRQAMTASALYNHNAQRP
jgi:hypothetical protein